MDGMDRGRARLGLSGLALAGLAIGSACLLGAGRLSHAAGLSPDPRSLWSLRLFGVRELLLGIGLRRAASSNDSSLARLMCELTVLAQTGDLAVTGAMLLRGTTSRRVGLLVLAGAPATAWGAFRIRSAYRGL